MEISHVENAKLKFRIVQNGTPKWVTWKKKESDGTR